MAQFETPSAFLQWIESLPKTDQRVAAEMTLFLMDMGMEAQNAAETVYASYCQHLAETQSIDPLKLN